MFNKKNKFSRLLFLSAFLILGVIFLFNFSSVVLASDTFGTAAVSNSINLGSKDPRAIAAQVINIGLGLLGVIALAIVIYAGFMWMTSEGQEDKIEKAKAILKAGVIGLIIILSAWGITTFVLNKLGGATGTAGYDICESGDTKLCGCDYNGQSVCVGGSWGPCSKPPCFPGSHGAPCSSDLNLEICTKDDSKCNGGLICGNSCTCVWPEEGDPCGEINNNTCSPDDNDCSNPNLTCDSTSCTCEPNIDETEYSELGDACNDGGSCSATENLCNPNHGLTCDTDSCKCIGNPVITAVSPVGGFCVNNINNFCEEDSQCPGSTCDKTTPNAAKGNFITILGYNFDTYSSSKSNIWFSKGGENNISKINIKSQRPVDFNSSCLDTWTNTRIIVAIATSTQGSINMLTGDDFRVEVHTKNGKIDISNDEVGPEIKDLKINEISRPGLCGISANEGIASDDIYYYGIRLDGAKVYFGNLFSSVSAFLPNVIVNANTGMSKVPGISAGETSTFVKKPIINSDIFIGSNILDFTKLADAPIGPSISSVSPDSGSSGQYVTMVGKGFGKYKNSNSIYFRLTSVDTEASFDFPAVCADSLWSDEQVLFKVPSGLVNGTYNLVLKISPWPEVIANFTFEVDSNKPLNPGICKISPELGPHNTLVSLWGEYFGQNCKAIFNNEKNSAQVDSKVENGADKIEVNVPANSITGPVKVSRDNITGNSVNFSVGTCTGTSSCPTNTPACCITGSPQAGACFSSDSQCYEGTPDSSVFQWRFTTGFRTIEEPTISEGADSCAGFNYCPNGYICPNAPGVCSNYAGSNNLVSGKCRIDCLNNGCETSDNCIYGTDLDKCIIGKTNETCNPPKSISYRLETENATTTTSYTCKRFDTLNGIKSYREISINTTNTSCPKIGNLQWLMIAPGKCVDVAVSGDNSTCSLCDNGKTCYDQDKNNQSSLGICVSACDLPETITYKLSSTTPTTTVPIVCKKYNISNEVKSYREISVNTFCPNIDGVQWLMIAPGKCVDVAVSGANSTCSSCGDGKTCYDQNNNNQDNSGICVSERLCSGDYRCNDVGGIDNINDECKKNISNNSCQCCCDKGQNNTTNNTNPGCCAPLTCDNTCGVSASTNPPAESPDLGLCSGCNITGASTTTKDLACNCISTFGKYCDISAEYIGGACLDCSNLSESVCKEHSATCCYDEKNNKCRGGASQADVWGSATSSFGICPYYNCDNIDPTICNISSPVINGTYPKKEVCTDACKDNCAAISDSSVCKSKTDCCWNNTENKCLGGSKFSTDSGLCAFYKCERAGQACLKTTTTTEYLKSNTCDDACRAQPLGPGTSCFNPRTDYCTNIFCNIFSCLVEAGSPPQSGTAESCGICCCDPRSDDDICSKINDKLSCTSNKGSCTGASRGLCCGCSSDRDCSPDSGSPADSQVGCGFDTCCQARPGIEIDDSKIASLDVSPSHLSENICRNVNIEINFDQKMDIMSLGSNILLLQEKPSGSTCSDGTQQIAGLSNIINDNYKEGFFATLKNIFKKPLSFVAALFGKTSIAAGNQAVYCSVMGLIEVDYTNTEKTSIYFKPSKLLEASAKYFVVVKGDEELNSQSGVKSFYRIGMNGKGFYKYDSGGENSAWIESGEGNVLVNFSGKFYKNSYIWSFSTMNVNTPGQGICAIDYLKINPSSYLFQDNKNDINENDADARHASFDSVKDSDKAYYVKALSADSQVIGPVTGYNWEYIWSINNSTIIEFNNNVVNWTATSSNRLVQVKPNILGGESSIAATVKMTAGNFMNTGDAKSTSSAAYVLICDNPWPAFKSDGTWVPWSDTVDFTNYNHKFYYCRDAGNDFPDTSDDLPAFMTNSAVIKGNSLTKVCSNNSSISCSSNNDCPGNGLCLVSFFKETYLFRNAKNRVISSFDVVSNADGESVRLSWISGIENIHHFLIYGSISGSPERPLASVSTSTPDCQMINANSEYSCAYVLGGLSTNHVYNIRVVAVNSNSMELGSSFSTSIVPTFVPSISSFNALDTTEGGKLKLSWQSNPTDVVSYKIYFKKRTDTNFTSVNVPLLAHCSLPGGEHYCEYFLTGLTNSEYELKVKALKAGSVEFGSSLTISAIPTLGPIVSSFSASDDASGEKAKVYWEAKKSDYFDRFKICWSLDGANINCDTFLKTSINCNSSSNKYTCSFTKNGLENDRKYKVNISVLKDSQTIQTSGIEAEVIPTAPHQEPIITSLSAIDTKIGGRAIINWEARGNASFSSFNVCFDSASTTPACDSFGKTSCKSEDGKYKCSFIKNGLIDFLNYEIKINVLEGNQTIQTSNKISVSSSFSPILINFSVKNVKTGNSALLNWTAKDNLYSDGFYVYRSIAGSGGHTRSIIKKSYSICSLSNGEYSCSYLINNLTTDQLYEFYIIPCFKNEYFPIQKSSTMTATPTFLITNFTVSDSATNGEVSLHWESPKLNVFSYRVMVFNNVEGGGNSLGTGMCVEEDSVHYCNMNKAGLANYTEYSFLIEALNSGYNVLGASKKVYATPTKEPTVECPPQLEYNGYNYNIVKMGSACWFGENLRTENLNDGSNIENAEDDQHWIDNFNSGNPSYSWYKNDSEVHSSFGVLYNKTSVKSEKLCPENWHVATFSDVDKMIDYLKSDNTFWCGGSSSNLAKSIATKEKWYHSPGVCHPGNDAPSNNSSNFSILPSGVRDNQGIFKNIGNYAYLWTVDGIFYIGNYYASIEKVPGINDASGFAVRCVQD